MVVGNVDWYLSELMNMKFKTRKREVHYFVDEICLDDHWFGLEDLIDTLIEVDEDTIFIRNNPMADALRKRKVAYGGSRHGFGATTGPNFQKFLARMIEYKAAMRGPEDDEE